MNSGIPPSTTFSSSAPEPGDALWQSCLDQLAQELPEQQFNTWIRPLQADVSPDLSKVRITVGNRFKLDWIRAQYAQRMAQLLSQMNGQPIQLELVLAQRESAAKFIQSRVQPDPDSTG
jgi:chromosomal replication initiator protein